MSMVLLHLMISLIIAYNVTKALPVFLDRRFNGNIADGPSGVLLFIVCLFPIIPEFVPTFIFFCIIFSLIVIVFYKGSPFRRIAFSAIFFSIIGAWSFLTVTCLGISALYDPPLWLENTILILLTALCILYFTIFSEYVGNADKESLDSFTERLWGYTAFIALCPPVIMLLAVMNPPDHPLETLLITCFIVAASTAMIPLICHIGTSARLARENARLKERTEYYREVEREQTQIRKFKHDLMNHFTVVATYLDLGENEKAVEYFKKIGADFAKISRRYTENPLINAVLNFAAGEGGFSHVLGGEAEPMSTEQALMAMIAWEDGRLYSVPIWAEPEEGFSVGGLLMSLAGVAVLTAIFVFIYRFAVKNRRGIGQKKGHS